VRNWGDEALILLGGVAEYNGCWHFSCPEQSVLPVFNATAICPFKVPCSIF